jgi:hypothetical protein
MSGVGITIRDQVRPLLDLMKTEAGKQGLTLVIGRSVANLTRAHLIALNAKRHKNGRNYYAQAARATSYEATPQGAVVSINQVGIRQRLLGGTIQPKDGKKFLTIPAATAAYGARAREFNDLDMQLVLNESGRLQWALVRRVSQAISFRRRKRKDGSIATRVVPGELRGGEVMYWLVRRVTQQPDPSVLPAPELMIRTGLQAAILRINRLASRAGQQPPEISS